MKLRLQNLIKNTSFVMLFLSSVAVSAQCSFVPGSTLVDPNGEAFLRQCFGDNVPSRGELLYRGTVDGMNASSFHAKCDGKGPTITLIKLLGQGEVFGGYNPQSWSSNDQYKNGSGGFLFNLNHSFKLNQTGNDNNQYQTYNSAGYGPTFGGGHDLYISQDFTQMYASPYSYENPNDYGYPSLFGYTQDNYYYYNNNVTILEIEVYATEPTGIRASGSTTICSGTSVNLTASGGTSYLWSNGSTNPVITASESGIYSVVISTNNTNCPNITYSKTVTVTAPVYLATTQTNSTAPGACNGAVALIPSGGVLPYNEGSGVSFNGTEINTTLVSYGGPNAIFNQTADGLQMRGTNGNWDNFIYTNKITQRIPGSHFQGKIKVGDMSNVMIGWHDNSNTPYYSAMVHSFYISGTSLHVYEHGQYMGYIGDFNANEWIEFKIELQEVGAKYYIKKSTDNDWVLLYTSTTFSDSELKMGASFYGYDYSNYYYYYYYYNDYSSYNERQTFYTKDWTSGVGANPPTSNLCAGTYTYTISDANGCLASKNVTITDYVPLSVSLNKVCKPGEQSFDLSTITTGGVEPYTYTWSQPSSDIVLTTSNANVVANGNTAVATVKSNYVSNKWVNYNATFAVTVSDATGNSVSTNVVIASSRGAMGFNTKNLMTINPACGNNGANGSIYFTTGGGAFGGAGALAYAWTNVDNNIVAGTTSNLVSAPAGNYALKTTDANGCTASTLTTNPAFTIPSSLIVFQESIVKPTAGKTDGSICINNVSGGVAPYTYSWAYPDVFGSTNCLTNLGTVSQYFKIKDKNGCNAKKAISTKSMLISNEIISVENEGKSILIYPNPTSDLLNINALNYTSETEGQYVIYTVQGQIIGQGSIVSQTVSQHNMLDLSPGMYYVKVMFDNDQQIFNVVKQ